MKSTISTNSNKLYDAIWRRQSVRSFKPTALGERTIASLQSEISYAVSRDASIHFQLRTNDSEPFKGFRASYGMFRNASNYLACVVDTSYDDCLLKAGYWAEMFVLKAVSLGLGTCFVGGSFDSEKINAQLRVTWRIPFVVLLGNPYDNTKDTFMSRVAKRLTGHNHQVRVEEVLGKGSLPLHEIATRWPALVKGLEAVAASPSALNRHPARIIVKEVGGEDMPQVNATVVRENKNSDIDLGIALANWEIATGGEWEFGTHPQWIPPFHIDN